MAAEQSHSNPDPQGWDSPAQKIVTLWWKDTPRLRCIPSSALIQNKIHSDRRGNENHHPPPFMPLSDTQPATGLREAKDHRPTELQSFCVSPLSKHHALPSQPFPGQLFTCHTCVLGQVAYPASHTSSEPFQTLPATLSLQYSWLSPFLTHPSGSTAEKFLSAPL